MPKRTDTSTRSAGILLAFAFLFVLSLQSKAQQVGSEFCVYHLDEKGQPQYVNGTLYLEPLGNPKMRISFVQFVYGAIRAEHVPAGDYDLVIEERGRPDRRVRVHFTSGDSESCNPQLVIREQGTSLETEWRDSRAGWVDPATDFRYTVNRLCGRLGKKETSSVRDDRFTKSSGAVLKVYKRVPDAPCCGESVAERTTGHSGDFDFRRLPEGPYWLTATMGQQVFKMPVRITKGKIYQNEGCPWFYPESGDRLEMQTTITVD